MMLELGYYYKKYNTPFNELPIGPFRNRNQAFKAAFGEDVNVARKGDEDLKSYDLEDYDGEEFAVIEVVFNNFAWGE